MYNAIMTSIYEDTIDFINMHYAHTDFDTPFWNFVKETHIPSETLLWYRRLIENGERLPNDGKGHFFGGSNWLCWLLQTEKKIGKAKNISSDTALEIMKDWEAQMDESQTKPATVTHQEAIDNYGLYLNMSVDPTLLEWKQ